MPVTLRLADGDRKVTVNQRAGPCKEGFVVLSTFSCPAGEAVSVTLGRAGTDGHVIADAVQFIERP